MAGPPTGPLRILVADDNRDNADSCAMLLQLSGHHVRAAYSGRDAIEIGADFVPQIVLLDIVMPEMDGYEAAQRIRAAKWGKGVLLVAITGHSMVEDKRKAIEAGFDYHFAKPVDIESLQQVIARCRATEG